MPRLAAQSPPPALPSLRDARELARAILRWYRADRRDLPWRHTRDPYAILVSEFMLQQTQVATVIPYYERFLKALPTVQTLADAPEQDVLHLWAGLGYYTRARNLHAAARKIVRDCGGSVPERFSDLLFLPGVGRYVAGAVASIAYGAPVPAVDANAIRVLCRVFALKVNAESARVRREIEDLASALVPKDAPGDFNQALMELGARVCMAREALCDTCPWSTLCRGRAAPLDYPVTARPVETVEVEEAVAVVRDSDRCLVVQRPADSGRYRGMWEFPHLEISAGEDAAKALRDYLRVAHGVRVKVGEEWAEIRHQVTRHRIRKRVFHCAPEKAARPPSSSPDSVRWATLDEIAALPLGAPHKRILQMLREHHDFFGI